jgi:Domain of unknown function (DUF4337)
MSEEFEVQGPHDRALEEVAEGNDRFSSRIAVMTAVLATIGALFGYAAGVTQTNAATFKNNAAIKKTAASDQWNLYQAKTGKQNIAELGLLLPGVNQGKARADIERYRQERAQSKLVADKLENDAREWDERSEQAMHRHHRWALAMTAEQVAIALAAIALLKRKKWLHAGSYGVAAIGIVFAILALMHL